MLDKLMTPELLKLADAFQATSFEIRIVGGAVRDLLLGETPKDIDLATDATPDEVMALARKNGFGVIPTGLQHGTVTVVVDGEPFEITTLRIDTETDGRHAQVEFTRSFALDAERRDLTINAMSMDFNGQLYDYFGGQDDLKDRVVRFVGIDLLRVQEDYLRILRYFRFAARFEADMELETLKMFSKPQILDGLFKVSVERFWMEMQKLLVMPDRVRIVEAMVKYKVAHAIGLFRFFPEELEQAADAVTALSTMIHGKEVERFLIHWKLSKEESDKIFFLVSNRSSKFDMQIVEDWLVDGIPRDWIINLGILRQRKDLSDHARWWNIPSFPIRGQDLLDSGMKPGKEVGLKLKDLQSKWSASRFKLSRDELLAEVV